MATGFVALVLTGRRANLSRAVLANRRLALALGMAFWVPRRKGRHTHGQYTGHSQQKYLLHNFFLMMD
jgi:hypothetical protein